jgi:hypothetical protein
MTVDQVILNYLNRFRYSAANQGRDIGVNISVKI